MSKLEGFYNMTVQLPAGLQCGHCVLQVCCSVSPLCNPLLQWTYTCGNSWGVCSEGGGRLGCGPQVTSTHTTAAVDIICIVTGDIPSLCRHLHPPSRGCTSEWGQ